MRPFEHRPHNWGHVFEGVRIMRLTRTFVAALLVYAWAPIAFAQGVQTGTIRGVVHDEQGLAVPGVTVTVTSSVLQSPRSAVTDTTGSYTLPNLPSGPYSVSFELSGFATVKRDTTLPPGLVVEHNITMRPAGVAETVQVVAQSPAPITPPTDRH